MSEYVCSMINSSLMAPDPMTLKKGPGETQYKKKTWCHRNVSGTNQIA